MITIEARIVREDGTDYVATGAEFDNDTVTLWRSLEFNVDPYVSCCLAGDEKLELGATYRLVGWFTVRRTNPGFILDEKTKPVLIERQMEAA